MRKMHTAFFDQASANTRPSFPVSPVGIGLTVSNVGSSNIPFSHIITGRFIVSSIYVFLLWILLFFFVLLPVGYLSAILLFFTMALFVHTITAFSSFGRVIMHVSLLSILGIVVD